MNDFISVHPENPQYFADSSGKTWIPIGLNMIRPTAEGGLNDYRNWLERLAANGGNYIRLWLSWPFFDVESEKEGVYSEEHRQRIDEVLAIAAKYNIRVKMTIEHIRGIAEEDDAPFWAHKPVFHKDHGGTAASIEDYLVSETSRASFVRKLDYFAEHYRNNDTVFAWELWNEVGCFKAPDAVWQKWSEDMLGELRKRFPNHLVCSNLCSFDCLERHNSYDWLCKRSNSDFVQIHRYLDLGAELDACRGPLDVLCADAMRILLEKCDTLPAVLAETGAAEWRHAGPSHLYKLDKKGMLLHDLIFAPFFAGAAGCGQVWHWDCYVDRNDLWHCFAPFAAFVKKLDPAAEQFRPFTREGNHLRIYALSGKSRTVLWGRDKQNTWDSELERENPPLLRSGMPLKLLTITDRPITKVEYFLPWASDGAATGELVPDEASVVTLPDFERSIILTLHHEGGKVFEITESKMQLREEWKK